MIKLRDYQKNISEQAADLLRIKRIAYLSMEVRTGKTLTALNAANLYRAKKVLFLTKKKAIKSIQDDYDLLIPDFEIQIINNESLHTVTDNDFDLLISDEHHRNSAFPKLNNTTKEIKKRFGHLPQIYLSGTPAIESGSQWYHSFWISEFSPFREYKTFYSWAKVFTRPKVKYVGAQQIKVYTDSIDEKIIPIVEPYLLKFTQADAGFTSTISENVLYCQMSEQTNNMIKILLKDRLFQGNNDCIMGDSAAKLLSKVHQLANGTVILESGLSVILDTSKAEFIKTKFAGNKMAIFYNFTKELGLLQQVIPNITTDLDEFNTTDKHIALQQVAGSEGISLKAADVLIYYNFGYSGKNFVQSRDRMTTIDRPENNVYFVYQKDDINSKIHSVLKEKKRYSETIFKKDFKC